MNPVCEDDTTRAAQLRKAFSLFNEMSGGLVAAYETLQARVAVLTEQLSAAHAERDCQLAETGRLAARLSRLLFSLPNAIVVLDGDGIVRESNPRAIELLGTPLNGEPWRSVIARAFEPQASGDARLRSGALVEIDTCSIEGEPGQIVALTDVTESRRQQAEASRQRRLIEMGGMAASLAHQIRTPLAAAMLYCSHLNGPELPPAERHAAERLAACLRQLERQVGNMLLFAHGGALAKSVVSIESLLQEVRAAVEPQADARPVRFECTKKSDARVFGNPSALAGALQNLATNAIQASPPGSIVRVRATVDGDVVCLRVSDSGAGIASGDRERVFEPYFTTRAQGNGLGLAVARAVADAHGGSIALEETGTNGSTFCLRLPVSPTNSMRIAS